ncbi:chromatin assembly factor 1 subunit A isoform X2 [Diabrotica virgifera virgifera]|uniref:Chromatin assembly factor 1 subunit A-like n=1 Tax=Diabrotica virgifera virgifera TaxID=50390 RepID=A0ABM5KYK0_DIAVI|nr:chromatin assembly factor 1 subunit A isoform X2 [Diabrotica virgifera virgifera]
MESTSEEGLLSRKRQHSKSRSRSKSPCETPEKQDVKRIKVDIEDTITLKENHDSDRTGVPDQNEQDKAEIANGTEGESNSLHQECAVMASIDIEVNKDDKELEQNMEKEEMKNGKENDDNSIGVEENSTEETSSEKLSKNGFIFTENTVELNNPELMDTTLESSVISSDNDEPIDSKDNTNDSSTSKITDTPKKVKKESKMDTDNKDDKAKDSEGLSSDSDEPTDNEKSKESMVPTKILKIETPNKKLTPKQLQKRLEMEKKQQERDKEREEKLKKRLEEKQKRKEIKEKELEQKQKEKEMKKMEKDKELEQRRKEKEEKEEKKRKEKEEREQKRKEKEEKEEQKRKEREEEKLKKLQEIEEKNKEKLKEEEKKQKAAAAFVNFFVAKKTDDAQDDKKSQEEKRPQTSNFLQFEVKSDMKLPLPRREFLSNEEKENLVCYLDSQDSEASYLKDLSSGKAIGKSLKTWPYEESLDDEIILVDLGETICEDKSGLQRHKAKFLYFHDNRRPAYYGTWRKKSKFVKPRKPLAEDKNILNYEEDSDDDWEEEEQGESLNGSEDEAEKDNDDDKDDYEVDNEFFVPHGHLSDDEVDDEELSRLSPDSLKQKLKLLKEEFDQDMKSKTQKLKPRSIGCIWYNKDGSNVEEAVDRYLQPLAIIHRGQIMIKKRVDIFVVKEKKNKVSRELNPDLIPVFLKLVHYSPCKKSVLVEQFLADLEKTGANKNVSKGMIIRALKRSACWEKYRDIEAKRFKFRWSVHQDLRDKYDLDAEKDGK